MTERLTERDRLVLNASADLSLIVSSWIVEHDDLTSAEAQSIMLDVTNTAVQAGLKSRITQERRETP